LTSAWAQKRANQFFYFKHNFFENKLVLAALGSQLDNKTPDEFYCESLPALQKAA